MSLIRLDNCDDSRLRLFSGLTDAQLKRGEYISDYVPNGAMIAESRRVIERALASGVRPVALFMEQKWFDHEAPVIDAVHAVNPDVPVFIASQEQFRELTGYEVTRGALAAFERPELPSVEQLLAHARRVAVLEDVTNYANIGTMFRTFAGLGVDAVLVSPSCHDPFYRRAARVSMGAVFQVPWTRIGTKREWAEEGIPLLRDAGFLTAALALRDGAMRLDDPALAACERLALVLGTEGDGLFPSTIEACDCAVRIPMAHGVDSLNVAVCAGIAFWAVRPSADVSSAESE